MIQQFDRLMAVVSSTLALIAGGLIGVILAVMVTDVTRRNVTGGSVAGAYEVITMMLVGVIFLGLAYAERTDSNIKLTLVTSRLPARPAFVARVFSGLVALAMCSWLSWATWGSARLSIERGEFQQGLLSMPIWPAKLVIAIGFLVLTVETVLSLRRTWIRARSGEQVDADLEAIQYSADVGVPAGEDGLRPTEGGISHER